jgi:cysteinyl-tRNA synthetase
MNLRIYNSATRTLREFAPLRAGAMSIYVCGATVPAPPHLGHARGGVTYDILRRWLVRSGYDVVFIRNVTDIDDKILNKAAETGKPWWAWASLHERLFRDAYTALGCLPPTHEPRATGHITEVVELTRRLIDAGHAYPMSGDVYFSVRSIADYGALSRQDLDGTQPSDEREGKRDPRDFVLWNAFTAAMDDDLGVPGALDVLDSAVRRGDAALDAGDKSLARSVLGETPAMTDVLGISPSQWRSPRIDSARPIVGALIEIALEQRATAQERKDFTGADAIRRRLAELGITVQDGTHHTRWELTPSGELGSHPTGKTGPRRFDQPPD